MGSSGEFFIPNQSLVQAPDNLLFERSSGGRVGPRRSLNWVRSTPEKGLSEACRGKFGNISPMSKSTDLYPKERNLVRVLDVGNQKLDANRDKFKPHEAPL